MRWVNASMAQADSAERNQAAVAMLWHALALYLRIITEWAAT
jgi:hypothetical protein